MAQTDKGSTGPGNTAIPKQGDHDRVAMLSLRADGTPDQHNPEVIGPKDAAIAAAKEQFVQQAVSAADRERQANPDTAAGTTGVVEDAPQDPSIEEAQKEHEKVAKAAESAAEKAINSLHNS